MNGANSSVFLPILTVPKGRNKLFCNSCVATLGRQDRCGSERRSLCRERAESDCKNSRYNPKAGLGGCPVLPFLSEKLCNQKLSHADSISRLMQKAKQPTFTRQTDVWLPLTFAHRRQTGYQCRREHISSRFWEIRQK